MLDLTHRHQHTPRDIEGEVAMQITEWEDTKHAKQSTIPVLPFLTPLFSFRILNRVVIVVLFQDLLS